MKQLTIVGTGMGPETLSAEGRQALAQATLWFGAPRLLETFKPLTNGAETKVFYPFYKSEEIRGVLDGPGLLEETRIAVLVSGDTGFYSAAQSIFEAFPDYSPKLLPGISSVSTFVARLGLPWQNVALLSAHGREPIAITGTVRRNRYTFCLTGTNSASIGAALCAADYETLSVHIGENLGGLDEKVYTITAAALSRLELPPLSVLLVVNEEPDAHNYFGLPDTAFVRAAAIPMTKSEIRALAIAKLALGPSDICWDVGAGTGSVTVEMALAAYQASVYAIERQLDALPLIRANLRRFHLGNVSVIEGAAPAALTELPAPDAVFIGGSGGHIQEIIAAVQVKNPHARMVITAITLETANAVLSVFPEAVCTQVSVARAKLAGGSHLFTAMNPVLLIGVGGAA
ncbi:precorrin-6Y C5,15-methyltransferase (decarboxylating) subunit CbiT [Breznakiellaceae bacterium SP9]